MNLKHKLFNILVAYGKRNANLPSARGCYEEPVPREGFSSGEQPREIHEPQTKRQAEENRNK